MQSKSLVVYHYFEKDESYRDNFLHFLLFGWDQELDLVIVISGPYAVDLPKMDNVQYVFTEPKKSDFGGYAELINKNFDFGVYAFIFFINSSVRGPFVLSFEKQKWYKIFLDQMQPQVGMVGTSICTMKSDFRHSKNYQERYGGQPPYSHVQTMAYVLRGQVFKKIMAQGFYLQNRDATKTNAIEDYEIHLSQAVINLGWNLACLMPEFGGVDYREPHVNPNPNSTVGDPNEVLGYFGRSAHPYEVIFIKTNRYLYSEEYLSRLTYSLWSKRAQSIPMALLHSTSMLKYIERFTNASLSGKTVSDFSFLPGALAAHEQLVIARNQAQEAKKQLSNVLHSSSWRVTAPFSYLSRLLRALK
jgi:hypothetical protein